MAETKTVLTTDGAPAPVSRGTMRIAFLAPATWYLLSGSPRKIGGAELNVYYLARELAGRSNVSVSLLADDDGQSPSVVLDGVECLRLDRHDARRYPGLWSKFVRRFAVAWRLLTLRADVVVTTCPGEFLVYVYFICKVIRRLPVVYRIGSDKDVDRTAHRTSPFLLRQGILNCMPRFSAIVCQTEAQMERLPGHAADRAVVVPNGHPLPPVPASVTKRTILWVSRYDTMKRPELFLDLADRFPDLPFVMIMPEKNIDKCRAVKERAQNTANVTFIPFVPSNEIQQFFDEARCLVITSEFEGFPNTIIQACTGATPVLSLRVNPDSVITKYGFGHVCNDDLEDAAAFIGGLTAARVSELGSRAWEYVRERHDIVKAADRYLELCRKLKG